MALVKFGFGLISPFDYGEMHVMAESAGNGGVVITREDTPHTKGGYVARCNVRLPDCDGNTADDWLQFLEDTAGGARVFGFKDPLHERFYKQTLESIGTGDGAETDFALDLRYVDASTLSVFVNSVEQTVTTHYSLVDNETAPIVRFVAAPGAALSIEATYEYFVPVKARVASSGGWPGGGLTLDTPEFEVFEFFPGARFV